MSMSAGGFHSLAITAEGSFWSWGGGGLGKLGHGAITADGAFLTWGEGEDGCLEPAAAQEGRN